MNLRNLAIWGVIIAVMIGVYSMMNQGARGAPGEISYSQLLDRIDSGQVKSATIRGPVIEVRGADDQALTAITPENPDDLVKRLEARRADSHVEAAGGGYRVGRAQATEDRRSWCQVSMVSEPGGASHGGPCAPCILRLTCPATA